ncbi:hypothetical protein EJ08DRAFT_679285 [Tothia fuscella]|uniref:Uncharacterized protein n=1 Tax=Tothia fuscella TaxID=1048955 RepID=A0A9P4TYU2_9PEZI|nr:hypothetical protein EJ08DRAFT_679285 [Tothia fuscella]
MTGYNRPPPLSPPPPPPPYPYQYPPNPYVEDEAEDASLDLFDVISSKAAPVNSRDNETPHSTSHDVGNRLDANSETEEYSEANEGDEQNSDFGPNENEVHSNDDEASEVYDQDEDSFDGDPDPNAQAPLQSQQLTVAAQTNEYAAACTLGYANLIRLVYDKEIAIDRAAIRGIHWLAFRDACLDILASITTPILLPLMGGNLARVSHDDPATAQLLKEFASRSKKPILQPGIYVRLLVDPQGLSPTPNELLNVVEYLREYALMTGDIDITEFVQIDEMVGNAWRAADTRQGKMRYLSSATSTLPTKPSKSRFNALLNFCNALESCLVAIPNASVDEPLTSPLAYVGYARDAAARNDQHHDHKSSNFLMDLTEATCMHLFNRRYRMKRHIVALLCDLTQAQSAEVLITVIANAYADTGGGFAHHSAAESAESAKKVTSEEWAKFSRYILRHTPFLANYREQSEMLQARQNEYDRLQTAIKIEEKRAQRLEEDFDFKVQRQLSRQSIYSSAAENFITAADRYLAAAKAIEDYKASQSSSKGKEPL